MEHIVNRYDLDIETITPIHIGSGNSYLSSECLFDGNGYNRIDMSRYFKQLDKERQNIFLKNLLDNKMLLENVEEEFVRYHMDKKFEGDFKSDNEIMENIKVFNEPYIPGSSLKGAIRTALLYEYFKKEDLGKIIVDGKINESLINSYFSLKDSKRDVLRFLKINDSSTLPKPVLYKVLNAKPTINGGFKKGIPMYLESIFSNEKKMHTSLITIDSKDMFEVLGFDKEKLAMIEISNIKRSIYNFSQDLISHEIEFCKANKLNDLMNFYKHLNNDLDAPVLKLGHGSGFLATTLGLKIKNNDKKLYKQIKDMIIKPKKDDKKDKLDDFPITRLIVESNHNPMGWVRLTFNE